MQFDTKYNLDQPVWYILLDFDFKGTDRSLRYIHAPYEATVAEICLGLEGVKYKCIRAICDLYEIYDEDQLYGSCSDAQAECDKRNAVLLEASARRQAGV